MQKLYGLINYNNEVMTAWKWLTFMCHFNVINEAHQETIFFSSPITGLEWPRGFQEVKVPRLHDNSTGWW
jgi:hypothetical protein